jgi:predicted RNA methylase
MWLAIIVIIIILILAISISWPVTHGAPWTPTPMSKVHKMLDMAEVGPDDLLYDLGCGDGRTIVTAARRYGARAVGIEIDPLRYLWCQTLITILGLRGRIQVIYGDFYAQDLSAADVVTCYLLQRTNEQLEEKFKRELRSSTRVLSHDFTFPGLQLISKDDEDWLYLYHPLPLG